MDKMVAWILGLSLIFVFAMVSDFFIEKHLDKEFGQEDE